MQRRQPTRSSRGKIQRGVLDWELELIRTTALRIRTSERRELEADLAFHLLRLKRRRRTGIHDWQAFLAVALRNKAANWIRNQQSREAKLNPLNRPREEGPQDGPALEDVLQSPEPDRDTRLALAGVFAELDPELKVMWELLKEARGNQVEVARQMGKHRNTIRLWVRKIERVLKRHGF